MLVSSLLLRFVPRLARPVVVRLCFVLYHSACDFAALVWAIPVSISLDLVLFYLTLDVTLLRAYAGGIRLLRALFHLIIGLAVIFGLAYCISPFIYLLYLMSQVLWAAATSEVIVFLSFAAHETIISLTLQSVQIILFCWISVMHQLGRVGGERYTMQSALAVAQLHNVVTDGYVPFIIDSGASQHIVNDIDLLAGVRKTKLSFNTANGTSVSKHVGTINLECGEPVQGVTLDNVHFLPDCTTNLLSVGQLMADGLVVDFAQDILWVDSSTPLPLIRQNNLWYLLHCSKSGCANCVSSGGEHTWKRKRRAHRGILDPYLCGSCTLRANMASPGQESLRPTYRRVINGISSDFGKHAAAGGLPADHVQIQCPAQAEREAIDTRDGPRTLHDGELVHLRLGHVNHDYINALGGQGVKLGLDYKSRARFHCPACQMGKSIRPSFSQTLEADDEPHHTRRGSLVYSDIFGKVRVPSGTGANEQYAIHFTDKFSRFTRIYFMTRKSQATERFREYLAECSTMGITVSMLQTDNAQEYVGNPFKKLCEDNGIQQRQSGPYMHESNGIAERIWRTFMDSALTMLITAQLPLSFWDKAMQHACYLRNRLPHRALALRTPYEMWHGKLPDLSDVRVFGCMSYIHQPQETRSKMDLKAVPAIYLGNNETSNTYWFLDLSNNTLRKSGMARFFEEFDSAGRLINPLFTPSSEAVKERRDFLEQEPQELTEPIQHHEDESLDTEPEEDLPRPVPVSLLSTKKSVGHIRAVKDIGITTYANGSKVAAVQVERTQGSPLEWFPLQKLLSQLRPSGKTTYMSTFTTYLRNNPPPKGCAPLFAQVPVNFPDDRGVLRPLTTVVVATDFQKDTDDHYLVCFADGGCMWTRAEEFGARVDNLDGIGSRLDSLAKANVLQSAFRLTVDWQFSPEEFEEYQQAYTHDVDACCNQSGDNALLDHYWHDALNMDWAGHNVWCNPPFHRIESFIEKFLEGFAKDKSTAVTMVVPFWPWAPWWSLALRHFHVVKKYKAGTRLFTGPDPKSLNGSRKDYGPTRWPVVVLRSLPPEILVPESVDSLGGGGGFVLRERALSASTGLLTVSPASQDLFERFGLGSTTFRGHALLSVDGAGNQVPRTVKEAKKLPDSAKWLECWNKELDSMITNNVGSLVPLPRNVRVLKSRVVFKIKYKHGKIERYKARFVACGYAQRPGFDYTETFSPVAQLETIRLLISLCCAFGLTLYHLDFETAFLQADLKETIYCQLPEGGEQTDSEGRQLCLKLHKSLYGLKQSPRNWNRKLADWLVQYGFKQCKSDTCLYSFRNDKGVHALLGLYVDDMPFASNSPTWNASFIKALSKQFTVGELEPINQLLQIQLKTSDKGVYLSQTHYVCDLAKRFGIALQHTACLAR